MLRHRFPNGVDAEALLVQVELLGRDIDLPINEVHEEALELIDVFEGNTAHLSNVLVCVISVVEHF